MIQLNTPTVTWKMLKDKFKDAPNDTPVLYNDPNFSGPYHITPYIDDFKFEDGTILIDFPFESPVD